MFVSPVFERQRQEDYYKFEVNLAYTVSSRSARAVSNTNGNKNEARRKEKQRSVSGGRSEAAHTGRRQESPREGHFPV